MLHPNTSQELSLNFYKDKKKTKQNNSRMSRFLAQAITNI